MSEKEEFKKTRKSFSGKLVLANYKSYYKYYGLLFPIYMFMDIVGVYYNRYAPKHKPHQFYFSNKKYAKWLEDVKSNTSFFVPFTTSSYIREKVDPKVFAFYLPQYHAIYENDKAYGKGFTEWTNVAAAFPQFIGHYQPKIPYDLGFYDLTTPGVMERQVEIAKAYGIYGFCFYYYWFSGQKVLERPLDYFLKSDIDFHFHFCWANENWSKRWDGGNHEVIFEQKLKDDDADKFFADLLPYISDKRYEKVGNKPILIIYKPTLFEKDKMLLFINRINDLAKENGFDGLFLLTTNREGFKTPLEYGYEGMVDFPPNTMWGRCKELYKKQVYKNVPINIMEANQYIRDMDYIRNTDCLCFRTCLPGWDNTPRRMYSGANCILVSDDDFRCWVNDIIRWTKANNEDKYQYFYVNAWNEWGEGAVLEPSLRFGYKYLDIIKKCIEDSRNKS